MTVPKSIGFPRMMKESGELRVFLPEFIQYLTRYGVKVYVEEGYGARSGFTFEDYRHTKGNVYLCSRAEAFQKDVIIMLRSPRPEEFEMIPSGKVLFSMLHFPTRPMRVERLRQLEINAISMDSVANDINLRLIENMHAVAWNGLDAAFSVLEERWPGLIRDEPFKVLILGSGMVGKYAADAAAKLGNIERNSQHIADKGPGSIAWVIGRNISGDVTRMEQIFRQVDILVDATQRRDTSKPVVPNAWLSWLPEHAVIADLAVDPYTLSAVPPVVRGIEGIPQGNLGQYIFSPTDPKWDLTVPSSICSEHRRWAVTCYSWPGIHPEACMRHYAQQMEPLMDKLIEKGYEGLSPNGDYFERALERATLRAWLSSEYYVPQ